MSVFSNWRQKTICKEKEFVSIFLTGVCSLVNGVVDLLADLEATVVVAELCLVERLWLVKAEAIERAHLIGVGVLLSSPAGAVPELTVG